MLVNYELYLTIHVKERMKERSISFRQIKNTLDYGKMIGPNKYKHNNVYVIFQATGKKIVVITVYNTDTLILSPYQESLWLRLYNLVDTCNDYTTIKGHFETINSQFAIRNNNKQITFKDFLLYCEPIVVGNYKSFTVENQLSHTLLSYALTKGNIPMIKCLMYDYDISPHHAIYSDYSILCETFRKLYSSADFPESSNQAEIYSEPLSISLMFLKDAYSSDKFSQIINMRNDNYSLLHRTLYNGLDILSNWLILNGANITIGTDNMTKYNETILDLISRSRNKLDTSWGSVKLIHRLQDSDLPEPTSIPIYNDDNIPYSEWKAISKMNKTTERKQLMQNRETCLQEETQKGTYAAVKFSQDDEDKIVEVLNKLSIQNPINKNDIHCTLLYSRKFLPNYEPIESPDEWAYPKELIVWDTFDKKRALVLKLDCEYLVKRHRKLMDEHKATWDFPEYHPHITLSYDIGDNEIPNLKDFNFKEFHIIGEYKEDLQLDWKGSK
jgi:hypothetical protein